MFIKLNDENKTVICTFNIEYIQKIINNLDDSYIKIGTSICKDDLILIYRNKEKLNKDYENLTKLLEESDDL